VGKPSFKAILLARYGSYDPHLENLFFVTQFKLIYVVQVMKMSKGKANPGLLNKILLEKLNAKD